MVSPVQLGGILEGVSGSDDLLAKLTRREQEVAALACQGLSNANIAGKLVVSVRTAEATSTPHTASSACQIALRSPPFSDLSN
jgi:FixJ family two-component response regulator